MKLNVHAILRESKANGPGVRTVIWFQGCSIRCEGCFNPQTHSSGHNLLYDPEILAKEISKHQKGIEGITISGGEPFDQPESLAILLKTIRASSKLSAILYSGYTFEQISGLPESNIILDNTDVLISGPFIKELSHTKNIAGSSNKVFHFLTSRYKHSDFMNVPKMEVIINSTGNIVISGISNCYRVGC
jgi:anaerobic ribonucleoside-triphosphate reductase activating protein